jgi:hypothetical protein
VKLAEGEKLRVAIFGCGNRSAAYIAAINHYAGRMEIVALCDILPERRQSNCPGLKLIRRISSTHISWKPYRERNRRSLRPATTFQRCRLRVRLSCHRPNTVTSKQQKSPELGAVESAGRQSCQRRNKTTDTFCSG